MAEKFKFELEKDENLEFCARIVSKIVHDSNNILGAIEGYVSFIENQLEENENVKSDLKEIEKAVLRHSDLNKKLLSFARRYNLSYEKIDSKEFFKNFLEFENSNCKINLKIEDADFYANRNQLKELIFELLKNSIEANNKNLIEIEISFKKIENFIEIKISDNGCGIPAENMGKIFEPFFTTKGNSIGLGLSIVYGIVVRHKGKIKVESTLNEGTIFSVYIPQ